MQVNKKEVRPVSKLHALVILILGISLSGCGGGSSPSASPPPPPPPPNQAPTAEAGADRLATTGIVVELDGSDSSDADNDLLAYKWSFRSTPLTSTAVIISPNAVDPNFRPDVDGFYEVDLIVNDGLLDSDVDTVEITSTTNGSSFFKLGWLTPGDGLVLHDIQTGLEWLNLSTTDNKSINEITNQFFTTTSIEPPAGDYVSFRFATFEEVEELYLNLGIVLADQSAADILAAYNAFDLLGVTTTIFRSGGNMRVQRGDVVLGPGLINSMGVQTDFSGSTAKTIIDITPRDFDFTDEDAGIFLVR